MYSGYKRTSTFITDMARTLSNITDKFKPGEVYNIGGEDFHTIEEVAEIVLRLTGKQKRRKTLVKVTGDEMLTTRTKQVDCAKARRELGHKTTVTLEEGIAETLEWMRDVYRIK